MTLQVLLKGKKWSNLYTIRDSPAALFSTRFRTTSEEIWHQCLGHPQAAVVTHLRQSGLIQVNCNKQHLYMRVASQ